MEQPSPLDPLQGHPKYDKIRDLDKGGTGPGPVPAGRAPPSPPDEA